MPPFEVSDDDWAKWIGIWRSLMTPKAPALYRIMPILVTLYRWRCLGISRPAAREEIFESIWGPFEGVDFWKHVVPVDRGAEGRIGPPTSTETLMYRELVNLGILRAQKLSIWTKAKKLKITPSPTQFNSPITYIKNLDSLHGSSMLYSFSGKGIVYFECLLNSPWLALSTIPSFIQRGYGTFSSLSWSIQFNSQRPRFNEKTTMELNIDAERRAFAKSQREVLGSFATRFWEMSRPETRVILEYALLKAGLTAAPKPTTFEQLGLVDGRLIKEEHYFDCVEAHKNALLDGVVVPMAKEMGLSVRDMDRLSPSHNLLRGVFGS
jgi:hypothetical protein